MILRRAKDENEHSRLYNAIHKIPATQRKSKQPSGRSSGPSQMARAQRVLAELEAEDRALGIL